MNNARVLILPSRDDNWGTVVCEAAACGMQLITTKKVGASADIVKNGINGVELDKLSVYTLKNALFHFENMTEDDLAAGSKISKEIARHFNSGTYYQAFQKIVKELFV